MSEVHGALAFRLSPLTMAFGYLPALTKSPGRPLRNVRLSLSPYDRGAEQHVFFLSLQNFSDDYKPHHIAQLRSRVRARRLLQATHFCQLRRPSPRIRVIVGGFLFPLF